MSFGKSQKQDHTQETMTISLHGGISHAQAAPEAQLPQETSTTLRNVLHHPPLRDTGTERKRERERWTKRWTRPQDRGSAVMSQSAPKPTDPALSLGLDNATQRAHTCSTYRQAHTHTHTQELSVTPLHSSFFTLSLINAALTSMSVWKLNKSIFCQLLPSRARTFHA